MSQCSFNYSFCVDGLPLHTYKLFKSKSLVFTVIIPNAWNSARFLINISEWINKTSGTLHRVLKDANFPVANKAPWAGRSLPSLRWSQDSPGIPVQHMPGVHPHSMLSLESVCTQYAVAKTEEKPTLYLNWWKSHLRRFFKFLQWEPS